MSIGVECMSQDMQLLGFKEFPLQLLGRVKKICRIMRVTRVGETQAFTVVSDSARFGEDNALCVLIPS